ncbi:hypothetical protein [Spiroplasma endosymbiont of Aleiodes alternator]|uniref:hypothetical protein n=1 Tax=Spiroplasma endosymbiont of Aleiodes alternator TaxID=3139329 RepID=UPI003CCA7636
MNTFLKVFLTQRLQFCVYFILDVHNMVVYLFTKFLRYVIAIISKTLFYYQIQLMLLSVNFMKN